MLSYPRLKLLIWYRAWQTALKHPRGCEVIDRIVQQELRYLQTKWLYCEEFPWPEQIGAIAEQLRERIIRLGLQIFDSLPPHWSPMPAWQILRRLEAHDIHASVEELNLALVGLSKAGMVRFDAEGRMSRGSWPDSATDEEWHWLHTMENGVTNYPIAIAQSTKSTSYEQPITLVLNGPAVLLLPKRTTEQGIRVHLFVDPLRQTSMLEIHSLPPKITHREIKCLLHTSEAGQSYQLEELRTDLIRRDEPRRFIQSGIVEPAFCLVDIVPGSWETVIQPGVDWRAYHENRRGLPGRRIKHL